MPRLISALLLCIASSLAHAAEAGAASVAPTAVAATAFDSAAMEKDLQRLTWPQFRSVVEAIPKLKADIEAYGELGWQIVRTNYMHYGWKRNIDRLDEAQKKELTALIEQAKSGHGRDRQPERQ